jgi:hypothetical protein
MTSADNGELFVFQRQEVHACARARGAASRSRLVTFDRRICAADEKKEAIRLRQRCLVQQSQLHTFRIDQFLCDLMRTRGQAAV